MIGTVGEYIGRSVIYVGHMTKITCQFEALVELKLHAERCQACFPVKATVHPQQVADDSNISSCFLYEDLHNLCIENL